MYLIRQRSIICYFTALASDTHLPFLFSSALVLTAFLEQFSLSCYLIHRNTEKIAYILFEVTVYLRLQLQVLSLPPIYLCKLRLKFQLRVWVFKRAQKHSSRISSASKVFIFIQAHTNIFSLFAGRTAMGSHTVT